MQNVILTWNGLNINDGNPFYTTFPPGQLVNLSAAGVTVPRSAAYPFLSTKVLNSHSVMLRVIIAQGKDIPDNRELLKVYFNIEDGSKHELIVKDIDDSDRQWFLKGLPVRVVEQSPGLYFVTIQLEMPVWRLVTPGATTWTVTASGQTQAITVLGNINSKPVLTITPKAARTGGLTFRRWVPIYNPGVDILNMPLEITDGGMNTAALVAGGKMQSDGADFRVWMDGVEVDRWLVDMNDTATKCWINFSLAPQQQANSAVTIANSGSITEISLNPGRGSLRFLQAVDRAVNKVVLIDDEAFTFTGVNTMTYKLTGVTRAAKGTSMDTHTAPSTVRWIEHDLWIFYGDSTLGAPFSDDLVKPIHDLEASTNEEIHFTNYYSLRTARPFAWLGEVNTSRTGLSHVFSADQNSFTEPNPSTALGCSLLNSPNEAVKMQETGQVDWIFFHPCGITAASYDGKKYTASNSWPTIVGLQALVAQTAWITLQNEDVPTVAELWQAFSRTVTFGHTYSTIRFGIDGSLSTSPGDSARVQFSAVVLTIDAAQLPVISVHAEEAINFFNFTLTNETTDEYIQVNTPCPVDDVLTISCEVKDIVLSNAERVGLSLSTHREAWLDLLPGSNTLKFEDTGTNNVEIIVAHRDRNL